MVSVKLSMAAATAALLQVAAARKCSASVADYVGGGNGGGGFHEYKVYASFADDKDNKLDSQDSDDTKALVIYDGVQTLKSDKLGGDILITASKNGKSGQSQLGGCTVEFMESGKIEGEVTGGSMAKTCTAEFDC